MLQLGRALDDVYAVRVVRDTWFSWQPYTAILPPTRSNTARTNPMRLPHDPLLTRTRFTHPLLHLQASALILPNAEHYSEDGASGTAPAAGDGGVLLAADALRCVCEGAGCVLAAVCELVALLHASYALPLCLAEGPYRDGFQALQHHTDVSWGLCIRVCVLAVLQRAAALHLAGFLLMPTPASRTKA